MIPEIPIWLLSRWGPVGYLESQLIPNRAGPVVPKVPIKRSFNFAIKGSS